MGGVCSCGFEDDKKLRSNDDNKSTRLSMRRRKTSDSYYSDKYGSSRRKSSKPDENILNFSGELEPGPHLRTDSIKFMQRNSFLGRAGVMGFEKAVEVLDTLGSSMSGMNPGNGFLSGATSSRGGKVSILAFEVANTIAKGAALLQSLSKENLKLMKKDMARSKGVKMLVSTDTKELQMLAASDKREELNLFSGEVIRFGNMCKDLQWHNLDRYFEKLDTENSQSQQRLLKDEAEARMHELVTLARFTSELYHELQALDRFEQDYRRKLAEVESLNLPRKGESIVILQNELKQQRKLVRSLQKKSLWSRNLEEITEKLVDVICYIRQTIVEVYGHNGIKENEWKQQARERLGEAGLSLHYANLIQQIDSIASRPSSLPSNVRDTLYNALPATVKTSLRPRLQTLDLEEELPISEIKAEMEKSLQWLVPLATNTTKAHQGFGWVGEWANSRVEFGKGKCENPTRLETLYHADKPKVDSYVLDLVVWLHRLMKSSKKRVHGIKLSETNDNNITISKTQLSLSPDFTYKNKLSLEDRLLLDKVQSKRSAPNLSKSQEFVGLKKSKKIWTLSRSTGNSPKVNLSGDNNSCRQLDVLDGLDFAFQ